MIRLATKNDAGAILSLIRELAAYEKLLDKCVATEELLTRHLFGEKNAAEAVVIEADGKIVGYAIYFLTFSTFLGRPGIWLEDVYVQPEFRNRGLGKSVFAYLAGLCAERDYGRLEWSVLDWNAPSIAFYKSLGAAELSEWKMMRLTGAALTDAARGGRGS